MTERYFSGTLFLGSSVLFYFGFQLLLAEQYTKYALPVTMIIFAAGCLSLSLSIFTDTLPQKAHSWIQKIINFLDINLSQLGLLVLSLPFAFIVRAASGDWEKMLIPWMAIIAWIAAITMAVFAGWKNEKTNLLPARPILLSLGGVFILALLVRIISPNSIPIFLSGDEGSAGQAAAQFASGEANNIFKTSWYAFPAFYFAIPGLFINIFGQTVFALRLASAVAGALAVVCTFLILKTAYGNQAAWAGAIFLSFLHFHVHFSRITLNNIWDSFWFTLTIGAIWYAWTHEKRNAYLLAGLSLGLSQYFYSSGRVLIAVLAIWLLISGLHDRARLKRALPDLVFFCMVTLAVALPLALFYIQNPNELTAPFNRVTILNEWLPANIQERGIPAWRILLEQFTLGFGAYVFVPLRHWYRPEIPILRPVPAAFFMIGLVFLFFSRQKKLNLLLILWLTAFAVIGALSESTPASQRYPASAPAVAMLVAIGLSETAKLIQVIWPRFEKIAKNSVIIVAIILAYSEASFYFFIYTPKSSIDMAQSNSMVGYRMGLYLRNRKDHPRIYFFGSPSMGFYSIPSTQYLAPQFKDGIDMNYPWGDQQNPPVEGDHLLFIILPFLQDDLAAIRTDYPGGKFSIEYSTDNQPLYYLYEYKRSP